MKNQLNIVTTGLLTVLYFADGAFAAQGKFEIDLKELRPTQTDIAKPKDRPAHVQKPRITAPAQPAIDTVQTTGSSIYTVRPGDHLHLILARNYRLSDKAAERLIPEIVRLNNIKNPKSLAVGQQLQIPLTLPLSTKRHKVVITAGPPKPPAAEKESTPVAPPPSSDHPQPAEKTDATKTGEARISVDLPCPLARKVIEQLGLLAPDISVLASEGAFAAANRDKKLVVACGLSLAERYTYKRMLASTDVDLLLFKGDEPANKVLEELACRLRLPVQRVNPDAHFNLPLTYLFPQDGPNRQGVCLIIE